MKRYDSYKDSGVDWIGEIPSCWEVKKIKHHSKVNVGLVINPSIYFDDNGTVPIITGKNVQVTGIDLSKVDFITEESNELLKKTQIYEGDLVSMRVGYPGRTCTVRKSEDGINCCSLIITRKSNSIQSKILEYQLNSNIGKTQVELCQGGMGQQVVNLSDWNEFYVLTPHLSEQQQIVSFLDTKTSLIDSLIEKTQRKIELLKEKRTSLINEVVTKGLNPNVEMKDSGVEWIGKIPSHWDLIKTYLISENLDGKRVPLNSEERSDIKGKIPYWGSGGIVDCINKYIFDEELLLVGEDGSPFFDSNRDVSFYVNEKIWVNNHIHILRSKRDRVDTQFLVHSFNSVDYKEYITGSTRDKLTQTDLNRIIHPIPPLSEQQQIVEYLDEQTQLIDKTISIEEKRIELLKEYRQSLISEVVTGKRKVVE